MSASFSRLVAHAHDYPRALMAPGRTALGLVVALIACVFASTATAHIDVLPTEATEGEAERFTVRVPSERELATTEVRVTFPPQLIVYSVDPAPGWSARMLLRRDGRSRGVVFRGGRIPQDQFAEFGLLATPLETGTALWRSEQVYADGLVKPWTGPPEEPGEISGESAPEDPGPSSATVVSPAGAANAATAIVQASSDDRAPLWLAAIAVVIASAAAIAVGVLWAGRPARLPGDDE